MNTAFCAALPVHSIKSCAESTNVINYTYNVYLLYKVKPNCFFSSLDNSNDNFFISLNQLSHDCLGHFNADTMLSDAKNLWANSKTLGTNKCNWFVNFTIFLRHLMTVFPGFGSFCNALGVFWRALWNNLFRNYNINLTGVFIWGECFFIIKIQFFHSFPWLNHLVISNHFFCEFLIFNQFVTLQSDLDPF